MLPSSSSTTKNKQQGTTKDKDPRHLPEVHAALLSHLHANSSEWATSELLDALPEKHPKLAQGMANPRYMQALQAMQANPKETLARLKESDPDIVAWLMEFCGVMGEHFSSLGAEQEEGGRKKKKEAAAAAMTGEEKKVREMGPLEEKALRRQRHDKAAPPPPAETSTKQPRKKQSAPPTEPHQEMDDRVASILANEDLRSILLDPTIQRIMEECAGTGGSAKLRYYMGHEEYGPKLRLLMEAGLLRLA